jgi:hypothetical protein
MDATEVLLKLVFDDLTLPDDVHIELIVHQNKTNWRQRNPTGEAKVENLREGLVHDGPFNGRLVLARRLREELVALKHRQDPLDVVSVTSRLFDHKCVLIGHLAIMNLHTEGFTSLADIGDAVAQVTDGMSGYLMTSGRFYHYYGKRLLSEQAWLRFLVQFLMPCVLVSPRYIGHSLLRGFCSVRLTSAMPHKPTVPTLLTAL